MRCMSYSMKIRVFSRQKNFQADKYPYMVLNQWQEESYKSLKIQFNDIQC